MQTRTRKLNSGVSTYNREWKRLSLAFLQSYPFCVLCLVYGRTNQGAADYPDSQGRRALVVDHIQPHRGDSTMFWDQGNWATLCSMPCHSVHKSRCEHASRDWVTELRRIMDENKTRDFVMKHSEWVPVGLFERIAKQQVADCQLKSHAAGAI